MGGCLSGATEAGGDTVTMTPDDRRGGAAALKFGTEQFPGWIGSIARGGSVTCSRVGLPWEWAPRPGLQRDSFHYAETENPEIRTFTTQEREFRHGVLPPAGPSATSA